ncbi:MAG: hypothetical protein FWD60_09015 [Candidatus Azobacteroides sp.]|nr:hypothetical protein [Candidatus Azobacteroides sp.]
MRLKNEIIERMNGYDLKKKGQISEEVMKELGISKSTEWRYRNENRDNGPLTTLASLRIISRYLDEEIEYLTE